MPDDLTSSAEERIRQYILSHHPALGIDSLRADAPLNGVIDSLAVLGLIGFIEPEFSIEVTPSDVTDENFATIGTIAGLVGRLSQIRA